MLNMETAFCGEAMDAARLKANINIAASGRNEMKVRHRLDSLSYRNFIIPRLDELRKSREITANSLHRTFRFLLRVYVPRTTKQAGNDRTKLEHLTRQESWEILTLGGNHSLSLCLRVNNK